MVKEIVSVSIGGFAFCRIGLMVLIWIAFIFRIKWILGLAFIILLLSAILTVKRAPMIIFWDYTFGLMFKTDKEILNVKAMRFAHLLGTILAGVCTILIYSRYEFAGWILVGIFAIMKTISAFGFCPASKMYVCMSNGGCCSFSKKFKSNKRK